MTAARILAAMERLTIDEMRMVAGLRGFDWTEAELEAIRDTVAAGLEAIATLDTLALGAMDPTVQFRIL